MKKTLFAITLAAGFLISCNNSDPKFKITNNQVGPLEKGSLIKDVSSIFLEDSIASTSTQSLQELQNEVEVFDKEGNKLMVLSPQKNNNPESPITYIQITDARYQTDKGVGVKSTYKDIKKHYAIDKIETTFTSIIVFLKDTPLYITIDKEELPEDIRYNLNLEVEPTQIPDDAKIKLFMLSWDVE